MQELLWQKGVNWNDYPQFFKEGSWLQRKNFMMELTAEELECIPEQHRPDGPVERSKVVELNIPPFSKVANREEVIFEGADPLPFEEESS